jgi:Zn-dependent protease
MDLTKALTWIIPLVIAITFHEAAHGYVARMFGDRTADRLGRITLNPFKHVDPFGTVAMPLLLALSGAPVFGYAKPVPVDMRNMRHPRRDMMWVAAAGPGMNLALAFVATAALTFFMDVPTAGTLFVAQNIQNFIIVNVYLAVFNMIPLPSLDGGKVMAGLLPDNLGRAYYSLERYGMILIFGLLVFGPVIGMALGQRFDFLGTIINPPVMWIMQTLGSLFGLRAA